jgi:hypothetical protein
MLKQLQSKERFRQAIANYKEFKKEKVVKAAEEAFEL